MRAFYRTSLEMEMDNCCGL